MPNINTNRILKLPTILFIGLVWLLATAGQALAQEGVVNLNVAQEDIGFQGQIKPGAWNPIKLTLENSSALPLAVDCRWVLQDFDKDTIVSTRRVTLSPRRRQSAWVYANVPVSADPGKAGWRIEVLDAESQQMLATRDINNFRVLQPERRHIAVSGVSRLGLTGLSADMVSTQEMNLLVHQHEHTQLTRGLQATGLPDRWYGYESVDAIILGTDIDPAALGNEATAGLREWVRRGGHLLVILPAINEAWTQSPVRDMLPKVELQRLEQRPIPSLLGDLNQASSLRIDYHGLVPKSDSVGVIAVDNQNNPVIVSDQYGFGAVTMIGIDISDGNLERLGLPNGRFTFWHDIFKVQSPFYSKAALEGHYNNQQLRDRGIEVGLDTRLIADTSNLTSSIQLYALAAILIFAVYWLLAAPGSFLYLKVKKQTRHSWLVFLSIAGLFSIGVWAFAWLLRPNHTSHSHVTFYDVNVEEKLVRCQSWALISNPRFARGQVALAPGPRNDNPNTIASPGLFSRLNDERGWVDVQTIEVDAAAPNRESVPFRGSAKRFQLSYLGRLDAPEAIWKGPTGTARNIVGPSPGPNAPPRLTGMLQHSLPDTLQNVIVVYCPGGAQDPRVWSSHGTWAPNTPLDLGTLTASPGVRLVQKPARLDYMNRQAIEVEGYMGSTLRLILNGTVTSHFSNIDSLDATTRVAIVHGLSFFDMLPPPLFNKIRSGSTQQQGHANFYANETAHAMVRQQARLLDLSKLTSQPRLIVIGLLNNSPNPTPVTLDGQSTDHVSGLCVVRYIFPVK